MVKVGKIYLIRNSENVQVYIGKTFRDIQKRFIEHMRCKRDDKFHTFVKNSDKSIFSIFLLHQEDINNCDLGKIEMKYIEEYDSYYNGYNSSGGGEGLVEISIEVKQKMSIAHVGLQSGEKHPLAKLNSQQVKEIRENIDNLTRRELAKKYNVCIANINSILINLSWVIPEEEFAKYKKSAESILQNSENYLRAKLNWKQVDEIRENINNLSRKELSKIYNTSEKNIGIIIRKLSWKKPNQ